jgi:hypothetical protein
LETDNKLENVQKKFASLCYSRSDQFGFSRKYDMILEYLNLEQFVSGNGIMIVSFS